MLIAGHHAGYTEAGYQELRPTGWVAAYMIGLCLLSEALALLTLGLVRPWGEVLPRWIPLLGERRVHPLAAAVPAGLGAVALTVLWTPMAFWWAIPHTDMTNRGKNLVGFVYLPLVAWGPLLGAITVAYFRRRTGHGEEDGGDQH
ncbi:hypothetical protein ACQHIV_03820 [Kribbella sp. GL6]|uniref:hypothetical protein n=1 Tax=Kribbella sp. GL6 TaxID=3419765 RepID=UPI003D06CB2B